MRITRFRTVLKLDTTSESSSSQKYKEVQEAVSEEDASRGSLGTDSMSISGSQNQRLQSNDALAQLAQSLNTSLSDFGTQQQNWNKGIGENLNFKA